MRTNSVQARIVVQLVYRTGIHEILRSDGERQWIIRLNLTVSDVLVFEIFLV